MARKTVYVCDITGKEGAEEVSFGWEGKTYSIDLVDSEKKKVADFLAKYLEVASEEAPVMMSGRSTPGRKAKKDGPDAATIRAWVQANDVKDPDGKGLSDRGRIPAYFVEQYEKAN